jgi:uncharacterized membrane protein
MNKIPMLLIITAVTAVLAGGVFFAWTCSVTPGLKSLGDKEYFQSFQQLNRAIQNPLFFAVFFGAAVLLPVCTWRSYTSPASPVSVMLAIATVSYLLGVMTVTIFGNVPINNAIDKVNLNASAEELKQLRNSIEPAWNRLNNLRTCASVLTIIALILACINSKTN